MHPCARSPDPYRNPSHRVETTLLIIPPRRRDPLRVTLQMRAMPFPLPLDPAFSGRDPKGTFVNAVIGARNVQRANGLNHIS